MAALTETELFPFGDLLGDLANQTLLGNYSDIDQWSCHFTHAESLVISPAIGLGRCLTVFITIPDELFWMLSNSRQNPVLAAYQTQLVSSPAML